MKNTLLAVAMAVALGFTGLTPLVRAAANDSTIFNMVKSAGAAILPQSQSSLDESRSATLDQFKICTSKYSTFRQTRTSHCLLSILRMHLLRLRGTKAT